MNAAYKIAWYMLALYVHIVFVLNHNYKSPLGRVLQWVNTVCLFNSFPQQWKKDAISVEATYILVNTIRQFSIVIQSHESSLPPLEKIKENGKRYWWELSPFLLQSNNLPVLSFMHDRTPMPQIQYTTPQEVHYSWYPAVFITLSIN